MEASIRQFVNDKMVIEGKITQLLVDFIQKYPDIKMNDVDIQFIECKDANSGIISTCVSTDINIKL